MLAAGAVFYYIFYIYVNFFLLLILCSAIIFTVKAMKRGGLMKEQVDNQIQKSPESSSEGRLTQELLSRRFIGNRELLAYGFSNFGSSLSSGYIGSFYTYFLTNVFLIHYKLIAMISSLILVWDAVNDPIMGILFDKTRTRIGKARPYLFFTPVPLASCAALMFLGAVFISNTNLFDFRKFFYLLTIYFFQETFSTLNSVPKNNLAMLMTPNIEERKQIYTVNNFLTAIGAGLPSMIIQPLIDLISYGKVGMSIKTAFVGMGLITAIISGILQYFAFFFTKERVLLVPKQPPIRQCIKYVLQNKPLMINLFSGILNSLSAVGGQYINFFYIDVMGSATLSLVCGTLATIMQFTSYSFIPFFFKRFTIKQMFFGFKLYTYFNRLIMYLLGRRLFGKKLAMIIMISVIQMLEFVPNAAQGVLTNEMSADMQDYTEWKTGTRQEGTAGAITGVISKFGNVISTAVATLAMQYVGYRQGAPVQTEKTKFRIFQMFSIIPQTLSLVSMIPFFFYPLFDKERDIMRLQLREQRVARTNAILEDMK